MRYILRLAVIIIVLHAKLAVAQYNPLWIPDTLSGTNFDLTIKDTFKQMIPGNQTITASINNDNFWGPTLIWNKGDVVHFAIHNKLTDTTTVHWHGIHLPAIMDGGPHQTIPPNTTWNPYWKVENNASTFWYHPHLDKMTMPQLTAGIGGLIIVRDSAEATLNLPRKYGVDDIPLVFTDRMFDTSNNQFIVRMFGDSIMVNGVLRPEFTVPAQVVRFRILGGSTGRSYDFGFSDMRTFYVIGNDGGLLDTPVAVTHIFMYEAERYEILADFTGQAGTSVNIKAFNSTLTSKDYGDDTLTPYPPTALDNVDFNILHLNVGPVTASPVTTIPASLIPDIPMDTSVISTYRYLTMSDSLSSLMGIPVTGFWGFVLNHRVFKMDYIDYAIAPNSTEIWSISNTSQDAHPLHIHDIQFRVLSIDGMPPPAYMSGWKDVVTVPETNGTVRLAAKFSDYSDSLHPYMFHCHIARHEDEGMMGQFIVGNSPSGLKNIAQNSKMSLFPNPARSQLTFEMADNIIIKHAAIINTTGLVVKEFDAINKPKAVLDLSSLSNGVYYLRLTDSNGGSYIKSYLMQ